jgi:simple sugar transport system ATP-binding protein
LALVGENGAGKSTLMNVLAGLYSPSLGEVRVNGAPVRFRSTRDALARGIAMVHQHFTLAPSLNVAENVVLGNEPTRKGRLDVRAAESTVNEASSRYGFSLDPRAEVSRLSVAAQQKVEIVKALHRKARVLVLDEPTAVLAPTEVEALWRTVRSLTESGVAVVLIAHKLREVMEVATRIAVMRRGRLVAQIPAAQASVEQLASWMLGTPSSTSHEGPSNAKAQAPGDTNSSAAPVGRAPNTGNDGLGPRESAARLEIQNLSVPPRLRGVSLHVHAGELVGIAGVDGNGQRELADVLTGLGPLASGRVLLDGAPLPTGAPALVRAAGVAHIPEDRSHAGIVAGLTVEENLVLGRASQPPFGRHGWIDRRARRARAQALVTALDIRPPDPRALAGRLSGGNQQKVVLARELDGAPRLIVAVQPTRGLDFAAVTAVHEKLREAQAAGAGVLFISLDLDELLALSDRLYVFSSGQVSAECIGRPFSARQVGEAMLSSPAPEAQRA